MELEFDAERKKKETEKFLRALSFSPASVPNLAFALLLATRYLILHPQLTFVGRLTYALAEKSSEQRQPESLWWWRSSRAEWRSARLREC